MEGNHSYITTPYFWVRTKNRVEDFVDDRYVDLTLLIEALKNYTRDLQLASFSVVWLNLLKEASCNIC